MALSIYQVDAFSSQVFKGNPAAVVPLETWLADETMQAIAAENNLAETAFFIPHEDVYAIRWFTPTKEVKLCGHATLASAFVLYEELGFKGERVTFSSLSGPLHVSRNGQALVLDFPAQPPTPCDTPDALIKGLGSKPTACFKAEDYLAVFECEEDIRAITPDHPALQQLDLRGVIATAPGKETDFVSRFFAPRYGIPEDPVTGSAHTQLTPYWADRLKKDSLNAKQISSRGGDLTCTLNGNRVFIAGKASLYMKGVIYI